MTDLESREQIQLSRGGPIKSTRARRITCERSAKALATLLFDTAGPDEIEAWWSPSIWQGDQRSGKHWEGADCIALDIDHVEKRPLTAAQNEQLEAIKAQLPGNVFHRTPKGCRLVALLDRRETSQPALRSALQGFAALVRRALTGVPWLHVDKAVAADTTGRLFFTPRGRAKPKTEPEPRNAAVEVLRKQLYKASDLALEAPAEPTAAPRVQAAGDPPSIKPHARTAPAQAADPNVAEAARRWNAEHPRTYDTENRKCPACGHKDCFGPVPDAPSRWHCFSESHERDSRGCGRLAESGKGWSGDALDLEAHAREKRPVDILREVGYLRDPFEVVFPLAGPCGFSVVGMAGRQALVEVADSEGKKIASDSVDPSKSSSLERLFTGLRKNGGVDLTPEQRVDVGRWLTSLNLQSPTAHDPDDGQSQSPAKLAARLAFEKCVELHHDDEDDRRCYADIASGSGVRSLPIPSSEFRRWLDHEYYREYGTALTTESRAQAIAQIEACALFDGASRRVYQRVARTSTGIYIDIGDPSCRVIEVVPGSWQVADKSSVRFRRSSSTHALPEPVQHGDVRPLRDFMNVGDDESGDRRFRLIVGFLLGALSGQKAFPILILNGEQGTGKSTAARNIRSLLDPRKAGLRQTPRELRDLVVASEAAWLVAYDNLSHLPDWLSDSLCALSTGSGFGTRRLYSDDEERAFEQARPILLNGIPDLASARPDLLDRALVVELPPLPTGSRRTETDVSKDWNLAAPRVLGGLLDALATALQRLPTMERPAELPRMADFALLVTAAEPALGWAPGTFLTDLRAVAGTQRELAVSQDAVAAALIELARASEVHWVERQDDGALIGTPTAWHKALNSTATSPTGHRGGGWPQTPKALTDRLKRLAPALREVGIEIEHGLWHKGQRATRVRGPS